MAFICETSMCKHIDTTNTVLAWSTLCFHCNICDCSKMAVRHLRTKLPSVKRVAILQSTRNVSGSKRGTLPHSLIIQFVFFATVTSDVTYLGVVLVEGGTISRQYCSEVREAKATLKFQLELDLMKACILEASGGRLALWALCWLPKSSRLMQCHG